jgi:nonsense-mediated mRNA decay protein 3
MFCVECGRECVGEEALVGGLCLQCFLERNPLVRLPEVIDLVRCPHCGAVKAKGGWRDAPGPSRGRRARDEAPSEEEAISSAVSAAVEDALEVIEDAELISLASKADQVDRRAFHADVQAEVRICGQTIVQEASTHVRLRPEACTVCSRRKGSYYEAIVQIRGARTRPATEAELESARTLVEEETARMEAASRETHLVKVEEERGGLDFYISTQSAGSLVARALAARFGGSIATSTSKGGRMDGRDLVRTTHKVRMRDLRQGDYVLVEGALHRVASATDKDATLVPAAGRGKRRTVTRSEREGLVLAGTEADVREAVVVSSTERELQLLDPDTLKTVELMAPTGFSLDGRESVGVLRHEGSLLLAR